MKRWKMAAAVLAVALVGLPLNVHAKKDKVKSFTISQMPTQTEYWGDQVTDYNLDGIKLQAELENGEKREIFYDEPSWCAYDPETGEQEYYHVVSEFAGKYRQPIIYYTPWYYEYGTWKIELSIDGQKDSYDITVKPYDKKQEGNLPVDQPVQCTLGEHQTNTFTFVPSVSGRYHIEYQDSKSTYFERMLMGNIECEKTDKDWTLTAGRKYTLELEVDELDINDRMIDLEMVKTGEYQDDEIKESEEKDITFDGGNEARYYTFIPEETGDYFIYSEGAKDIFDPQVNLYVGDLVNLIDSNDDNSQGGHIHNFGLRYYLQKGQKYIFEVFIRNQRSSGELKVKLRKEETDHEHQWNSYYRVNTESNCAVSGKKVQQCSICEISKSEISLLEEHHMSDYVVSRLATVLGEGKQERVCTECGYLEEQTLPKLPATISLNTSSITLKTGQSTTAVKVSGLTEGDSVASWKSDKPKVAKVDKNGKITAGKKTGTATITVTLKSGTTATVKVKVQKKKVDAKKIIVNKKNVTLKKKKSYKIKAELQPITASDKVKFTSNNKKVATVNAKGVVKAKKAGTAKITVKAGKKKVVVTVKVK